MSTGLKQPSKATNPRVPVAIRPSNGFGFGPMPVTGDGSFGEVVTGEITPMVQRDFIYGGHVDEIQEITDNGGSILFENSQGGVRTGLTAGALAILQSDRVVRYRPGQGQGFKFTAVFPDGPAAGVRQLVGALGAGANGIVVGYKYDDTGAPGSVPRFGICRQRQGAQHIHSVEVTAGASGSETVTLTLNGTAYNVPVTAGTTADNAQEIAEFDFGVDWTAEASGDFVYLLAHVAGVRGGTYSISSTGTLTGTLTEEATGALPTEDWAFVGGGDSLTNPADTCNRDALDGTGPSGMVIDPTKGNIWRVKNNSLGTGRWSSRSRIRYLNSLSPSTCLTSPTKTPHPTPPIRVSALGVGWKTSRRRPMSGPTRHP